MGLTLKTPPAEEAITLEQAKAHLRVSHTSDDAYISHLIGTARRHAEQYLNRSIVQQTWTLTLDDWPGFPFVLPMPPLILINHVKYTDSSGAEVVIDPSEYTVDLNNGRIFCKPPAVALTVINGVEIEYVAGYEPDDSGETVDYGANVPDDIKHAMLLLVGHWYENREEVATDVRNPGTPLPKAADALLNMYRVWPI
jgi:uncharacterized phiE125 gp8 family phage protein